MANPILFGSIKVVIRGGGDLGSGVAYRLVRAGFPVLIAELAQPQLVRRRVSYGSAVIEGEMEVEGLRAIRVAALDAAQTAQTDGLLPVIVDPDGVMFAEYAPAVLVDARLLKKAVEQPYAAPLTIGLGPGFQAGLNCDAVIETNRGHNLGRVITQGAPEPNTGIPGQIAGKTVDRVLRSPSDGIVRGLVPIGAQVEPGQTVAEVDGMQVVAPFAGVLRGLVHDGLSVHQGMKIGDVDARGKEANCLTISDKALAVGGGVVEAVFGSPVIRALIYQSVHLGDVGTL